MRVKARDRIVGEEPVEGHETSALETGDRNVRHYRQSLSSYSLLTLECASDAVTAVISFVSMYLATAAAERPNA